MGNTMPCCDGNQFEDGRGHKRLEAQAMHLRRKEVPLDERNTAAVPNASVNALAYGTETVRPAAPSPNPSPPNQGQLESTTISVNADSDEDKA